MQKGGIYWVRKLSTWEIDLEIQEGLYSALKVDGQNLFLLRFYISLPQCQLYSQAGLSLCSPKLQRLNASCLIESKSSSLMVQVRVLELGLSDPVWSDVCYVSIFEPIPAARKMGYADQIKENQGSLLEMEPLPVVVKRIS